MQRFPHYGTTQLSQEQKWQLGTAKEAESLGQPMAMGGYNDLQQGNMSLENTGKKIKYIKYLKTYIIMFFL